MMSSPSSASCPANRTWTPSSKLRMTGASSPARPRFSRTCLSAWRLDGQATSGRSAESTGSVRLTRCTSTARTSSWMTSTSW